MLSLDMTDEDRAGCCLLARLIPKRSCDFSSLINKTESPAKSLLVLTKTLQPVVSRCLFGWPR
uniref:Auxin response factor n=1 Tax=Rhizophora mucronata TaxID=61149 RepID=A0A2P2M9T7_RHIMU